MNKSNNISNYISKDIYNIIYGYLDQSFDKLQQIFLHSNREIYKLKKDITILDILTLCSRKKVCGFSICRDENYLIDNINKLIKRDNIKLKKEYTRFYIQYTSKDIDEDENEVCDIFYLDIFDKYMINQI